MIRRFHLASFALSTLILSGCVNTSGCHYTKPAKALAKACKDADCRSMVEKHLPKCERSLGGATTKSIKYDGGTQKATELRLATIKKLSECISTSANGRLSADSYDFSRFEEVDSDVFAKKMVMVSESCVDGLCNRRFARQAIGTTKNVFYRF